MKQLSVALVAGARPNFMKVAPLFHALSGRKESARRARIDLRVSIVHTGQHYDPNMSEIFFRELGMPEEINRKLTDAISDLLFVTEESGMGNPRSEFRKSS